MRKGWHIGAWVSAIAAVVCAGYLALAGPVEKGSAAVQLFGNRLELISPHWLCLLALLPGIWLFVHDTSITAVRWRRHLAAALRCILLLVLVLALAQPAVVRRGHVLSVVVLVDQSDSISTEQLRHAASLVSKLERARGPHDLHILKFAQQTSPDLNGGKLSDEDRRHTQIQLAIQHAYALIPADRVGRIVLVSDGNETVGDVIAEAREARRRRIPIDVYPYPASTAKEVALVRLRPLAKVRSGEPFRMEAIIKSTYAGKVRVSLYRNDEVNRPDGHKIVHIGAGRSVVRFGTAANKGGITRFRAKLGGMANDRWSANNSVATAVHVRARPRVLLVERQPIHAAPLMRALTAEKMEVDLEGPDGLPTDAAAFDAYDLVVLGDVSVGHFTARQLLALQTYVRDRGGGFIMLGGPESFGAGGYYGTPVARILPVRFETQQRHDRPTVAIVLCIDRSSSMSGEKLTLAKEAAQAAVGLLSDDDEIGVVAFDDVARSVVKLRPIADRSGILRDISDLTPGGGTSIISALSAAHAQLSITKAKTKHVVLLSDGQSPYSGIPSEVDRMASEGITVSAVGVGTEVDRTLLQLIASRGKGRFYYTQDPDHIPAIFTKETARVTRSALVERPTKVHVLKRSSILKGLEMHDAPLLQGYVHTKAKPLSEVILASANGDPLLATWRLGLGKAAAFTSDAKGRWASDWIRWRGYRKFWAQLVRETMRYRFNDRFRLKVQQSGRHIGVAADAVDEQGRYMDALTVKLQVADKDHLPQSLDMRQVAAGRYEVELDVPRYGAFALDATFNREDLELGRAFGRVDAPYPLEFARFAPDLRRLRQVASTSGGLFRPTPAAVFDAGPDHVRFRQETRPWLLLLAVLLLLLDVFFRRFLLTRAQR